MVLFCSHFSVIFNYRSQPREKLEELRRVEEILEGDRDKMGDRKKTNRIDIENAAELSLDEVIKNMARKKKSESKVLKSLDEIIKENNGHATGHGNDKNGQVVEGRGRKGRGKRQEEEDSEDEYGADRKRRREDGENSYVMTPLEAIQELTTKHKLVIELEVAKQTNHGLGKSHNWRGIVKCGSVSGKLYNQRLSIHFIISFTTLLGLNSFL